MNLLLEERVNSGELEWTDIVNRYRLDTAMYLSLVESNIEVSELLQDYLGIHDEFSDLPVLRS